MAHVPVVLRGDCGHVASLTSAEVDPSAIGDLVAACQEAALSAPEARDSAPALRTTDAPSDWDATVPETGMEATTFFATSGGLQRRYT